MLLLAFALLFVQEAPSFAATDHRPMAAMLDKLEAQFGVPIHYEDPRFVEGRDTEDVATEEIRVRVKDTRFKLNVPKRAQLTVPRTSSSSLSEAERTNQIQAAIDAYPSTGLLHEFVLERNRQSYFVGPRSGAGQLNVMSTPISIPLQQRSAIEALALLFDVLSREAGVKVVVGQAGYYLAPAVTIGAQNEPARNVLIRVLGQIDGSNNQSYRALYDPKLRYYMVNFQSIGGML